MAEAFVGGSFLSAFLQVLFDRMASPQVWGFFEGQKLDDGLLKDLKATMRSVNKLLNDAEEKQITDSEVKDWLDDLKDAVYEADDFFDEIAYEAMRLEVEGGSRTSTDLGVIFLSSLSPFNKVKEKMVAKLEEISRTLERLLKRNGVLGLKEVIGQKESTQKLPTTSLTEDSFFYGREDDQETIVKLLLSPDANGKTVGAIPIVGMGGVGKTTLSQFVLNDSRVQKGFDLKAWVCVSVDFDVHKLTKDILMEVGSQNCDAKTLNGLHQELEEKLKGKKVLLVLDDVWSSDQSRWDFLLKPFKSVAEGSKLIVTTRNENIVPAMHRAIPRNQNKESSPSPISIHRLMGLTEDICWILFKEHAFNGEDLREHPDLEGISRQIASKCKGLPLAAKTLGRLLCFERNAEKWEEILKSHIWESPNDEIIPALQLSYYHLPPHLKRCFAFCSIYPKDYRFLKEDLVRLWLAEGLVQPKGCKEIVKLGEEYFDDLLSRSLFQRSRCNESVFVMHDLINDLAKVVSGEFSFTLVGNYSSKISGRVRHLSYPTTDYDALDKFEGIDKAQVLRTFLPLSHRRSSRVDGKVQHDLLPTFMRLRVLSLAPYQNVVQLHDSIGRLKHLRYLDLTATPLKKLPEFVCSLYNLQTLLLDSCMCLVELPNSIGNLKNLLFLRLHWTAIQSLPESIVNLSNLHTLVLSECKNLTELPTNMGKLTKLERLTDFFVGKQSGSGIEELGKLQNLQGELRIWNLQNVLPSQDGETAMLLDKQRVKELELRWAGDTEDTQHERRVLEKLKPHKDVKRLSIIGFGGTRFPDWMGSSSFPKIVFLKLKGCKYCTSLPPLGQLVSLKELRIEAFDLIDVVCPELFGNGESKIRILSFEDMKEWREWNSDGVTFPLLKLLLIRRCPELRGALPGHLPALEELCVDRCPLLMTSLPRAPTIRQMELFDTSRSVQLTRYESGMLSLMVQKFHSQNSPLQGIEHIGVSTTLEKIEVHCCDSLKLFQPKSFPNLEILRIWDSPHLESLVDLNTSSLSASSLHIQSLSFPNLSELCVGHCSKLKWLPQGMHYLLPSLKSLSIEDCPELESFPEGGLPSKLQSLNVQNCKKLIDSRKHWGLQSLLSLSKFRIGYNEDVESFPEEMLLPSTLTSLTLSCLENLKYLDSKGVQHLTSLAKLTICSCPKLESLPEEGFAASKLQSLAIWGCHSLIARRMQWDLCKLPSLSRFRIGYCDDVESFPEETLLPSTLTSLEIWSLEKLKSLNYKGLQHLTSLARLKIRFCRNLHSMPEEKLPSSLTYLDICGCPVLEKRCEKEKGEDWPKISHIPYVNN
ncbi:hypothetical protein NC653_008388 [Populus alba x Populus x berolinensis]|uniref:Disease resistance RPP13-like protein 1 n=1 Tax=Populus alba x Populus x berolinensis TaxID=444605 RepID=A0AAD6R7I0_9ROSI|nr:hypothetical protein NC653_008388 [Populus alba x Populus x berolinensis]